MRFVPEFDGLMDRKAKPHGLSCRISGVDTGTDTSGSHPGRRPARAWPTAGGAPGLVGSNAVG
jgi:hypothetical protein